MISVEEALAQLLPHFPALSTESVSVSEGLGRTLADPIYSPLNLPPFANSSMDGFAIRAAGATLTDRLPVIGDIPAGIFPGFSLEAGQAARIMTGAALPIGADTIIPVEATDLGRFGAETPATIRLLNPERIKIGDYIRRVGEDVQQGAEILPIGRALRAVDIGMVVSMGIGTVTVTKRPKIALLSTGDELVEVGHPLTPGKIYDANRYLLASLIRDLGATVIDLGIAEDRVESVESRLRVAVTAGADLILSSAGVSVGAFDVVKTVLEQSGSLTFWKVNVRPGKPLAFGHFAGVPYLGLPGNPVSAAVTFDLFARPAILALSGLPYVQETIEALTTHPIQSDGRRSYLRVTLHHTKGAWYATLTGTQSSGALSSLVKSDGLLIVPEGVTEVSEGSRLRVRRW
jgi:molybdopterin molybdotransferase